MWLYNDDYETNLGTDHVVQVQNVRPPVGESAKAKKHRTTVVALRVTTD